MRTTLENGRIEKKELVSGLTFAEGEITFRRPTQSKNVDRKNHIDLDYATLIPDLAATMFSVREHEFINGASSVLVVPIEVDGDEGIRMHKVVEGYDREVDPSKIRDSESTSDRFLHDSLLLLTAAHAFSWLLRLGEVPAPEF